MDYLVTDTELTSVADAIRAKSGGSSSLTFPSGFISAIQGISGGKAFQICAGRDEVASTSYVATSMSLTVEKSATYKICWVMDRNTTSGTTGTRLYRNGSAVGSAHTSWTNEDGYNRNGKECTETLSLSAGDTIVVRARSRSTSYICGISNLIIFEQ